MTPATSPSRDAERGSHLHFNIWLANGRAVSWIARFRVYPDVAVAPAKALMVDFAPCQHPPRLRILPRSPRIAVTRGTKFAGESPGPCHRDTRKASSSA